MQVKVINSTVYVSDSVTLEELASIIEEYYEYTIYITDEFSKKKDTEW